MADGGTVKVRMKPALVSEYGDLPADVGYVTICVEDNGKDMDDETLGRFIESFFSIRGAGKGTGLVHGLSLQLGGALRIQSTASLLRLHN